jgi:hypothetical protein
MESCDIVESFCFTIFLSCCLAAGRDDAIATTRLIGFDEPGWWIDIGFFLVKKSVFLAVV